MDKYTWTNFGSSDSLGDLTSAFLWAEMEEGDGNARTCSLSGTTTTAHLSRSSNKAAPVA
jgi:hypothetical protein